MSLPPGVSLLFGEMTHPEKNVTNTPAALVGVQRRAGRSALWRGRVPTELGGRRRSLDCSSKKTEAVYLFNLLTAASPTLSTCLAY